MKIAGADYLLYFSSADLTYEITGGRMLLEHLSYVPALLTLDIEQRNRNHLPSKKMMLNENFT